MKHIQILCSSDIHGDISVFKSFARELKKKRYEFGVLAGDLIDEFPTLSEAAEYGIVDQSDYQAEYNPNLSEDDFDAQIRKAEQMLADQNSILNRTTKAKQKHISEILESAGKKIFFVLGNHDNFEWPESELIIDLHQKVIRHSGITLAGYRYTLMEKNESEISQDLEALRDSCPSGAILVTHSPAFSILDTTERKHNIGSQAILELVEAVQPRVHIFGHVHEAFGSRQARFYNVSYFLQKKFVKIQVLKSRIADTDSM